MHINATSADKLNGINLEITQRLFRGPDCYPWMQVYAWLPVKTISGRWVWWQHIYKRRSWVVWGQSFHTEPEVEYGDIFDVLENPCLDD